MSKQVESFATDKNAFMEQITSLQTKTTELQNENEELERRIKFLVDAMNKMEQQAQEAEKGESLEVELIRKLEQEQGRIKICMFILECHLLQWNNNYHLHLVKLCSTRKSCKRLTIPKQRRHLWKNTKMSKSF